VEKPKNSLANLIVYLGLKRNLLAEGWAHHELFVVDGYDAFRAQHRAYGAESNAKFNHPNRKPSPKTGKQGISNKKPTPKNPQQET